MTLRAHSARYRSFAALALVGTVGCGGSCGTDVGPVPGGFAPELRIGRAAQIRLTGGGLGALSQTIGDEAINDLSLACSTSAECPAGFIDNQGAAVSPSCVAGRCQEGGARAPYLALPTPSGAPAGLTLCPSGGAPCLGALRFAGVNLSPRAGQGLAAALQMQISADLSVQDPVSGADCLLRLRPVAGASPVQALIDLGVHGPTGALTVGVQPMQLGLPSGAVSVLADPVSGTSEDAALCAQLDPAPFLSQLDADLTPAVRGLLAGAFGQRCNNDGQCPSQSTCDVASRLCIESATGRALADPLAYDTRLQLPALLGELGYRGTSGQVDTAIAVGGHVDIDPQGMAIGVLAGLETATPNPTCATITPSPITRPGYVPPPGMPSGDAADLDFDGVPETPYDVAFGASQDLLGQVAWGIYTSGLLCGVITHREFDGLTTGALELIIPSVRFLARSHLYPRSEAPARLSVYMRSEPEVVLGTGQMQMSGSDMVWTEPLLRLDLKDVEINLSVLMDERWVRVLTITLDLHIGIGAVLTPNNEIEPILGVGVPDLVSNVRVTHSELLAEPPASLETSIPTLLSLLVLELSGSQGAIALPELPGLDLTVLGLRGEDGPLGDKQTLVVYANAQPAMQGNLHASLQTQMDLVAVHTPPTEAFSVLHEAGPELPSVQVSLPTTGPEGAEVEHQLRVDGGPWGPFFLGGTREVSHPAFLLQGVHRLEARSRIRGMYQTLDATPAELQVRIDSVAPELNVQVDAARQQAQVEAWDRVGPVQVWVQSGPERREVEAGEAVALPELSGPNEVRIVAVDGAGNATEVVVQAARPVVAGPEAQAGGCTATRGALSWFWVAGLVLLMKRRRY